MHNDNLYLNESIIIIFDVEQIFQKKKNKKRNKNNL